MAIGTPTLLQSRNPNATNQASLVFTIGATGAAVGDLVYMVLGFGLASTPTVTVTDSKGNTWTQHRADDKTTSQTPHSRVYSSVLTTALVTSDTVTATPSANFNFPMGSLYKVTGTWDANRVDQNNGATSAASTSLSSGNITTTVAAEILVAAICWGATGIQATFTPGTGWTAQNGLSGTTKSFIDVYKVVSATGTYVADGTHNSAEYSVSLVSFKEVSARTLAAGAGSYAVTGSAATLKVGHKIAAAAGSYAVSGTAATLKVGSKVSAASGTYAVTGSAATLKISHKLAADAGSYAITGSASALNLGSKLAAVAGSYAVNGSAATLKVGYKLGVAAGSYSIAGSSATLKATHLLSAGAGSYVVTGSPATLTATIAVSIVADSGSYTVSGSAAALKTSRKLVAAAGSYVINGSAAFLKPSRVVDAVSGAYVITGSSSALKRTHIFSADSGAYAVTGADIALAIGIAPIPSRVATRSRAGGVQAETTIRTGGAQAATVLRSNIQAPEVSRIG